MLQKLERRNYENGSLFWPTATTADTDERPTDKFKKYRGIDLATAAGRLWPTAQATDYKGTSSVNHRKSSLDNATEQKWQTPRAGEHISCPSEARRRSPSLSHQAQARWATPRASIPGFVNALSGQAQTPSLSHQDQEKVTNGPKSSSEPRRLNPLFVEWLMGLPIGWTACDVLGTGSFRSWRRLHFELLRRVLAL